MLLVGYLPKMEIYNPPRDHTPNPNAWQIMYVSIEGR
jgi:hypothetical protein